MTHDADRELALTAFVDWCGRFITGDEKSEAQTFVGELFRAFNQPGPLEVGGKFETRVRSGEDKRVSFADYVWKPVVLIEMKKRGADLGKHRQQALDYWIGLTPNRPAYVILCNFDEFWVFDFNADVYEPQDKLSLADLPRRYGPLNFLFPLRQQPVFRTDRIAVTRAAADKLAECFRSLAGRKDVGRETAQRFILQMLIALFSEDIGLLPKYFVTRLLKECTDPPKAFDLLGGLFEAMSRRDGRQGGRYKDVPYFNGGIFTRPAPVELHLDEHACLLRAAEDCDWSSISPDIFGTIFQHSMDADDRHAFGAHYTAPIDILKIVKPTIVDPWTAAIESAESVDSLRALQQRMVAYRVLDPACGSGNFLYMAYRELKRLEVSIADKVSAISPRSSRGQRELGFVTSGQFFGLDVLPFAVELAKVTMALAHKLVIDELKTTEEKALPLDNLDGNILCRDALIDWPLDGSTPSDFDPKKPRALTDWPKADVIIGNPPFLDARKTTKEKGRAYVKALELTFPDIARRADYCTYWLRRTHDHLASCSPSDSLRGRAGLVGTQNIRNNEAREGGLDHIVKTGTIIEAVENQPWSGEANVHVSIANWVKHDVPDTRKGRVGRLLTDDVEHALLLPAARRLWRKIDSSLDLFPEKANAHRSRVVTPGKRAVAHKSKSYELEVRNVQHINSALSDEADVSGAVVLEANRSPKRCFEGQQPGHKGFRLSRSQLRELRDCESVDAVVHPYLIGDDLLGGDYSRAPQYVIDCAEMTLEQMARYPRTLKLLESSVLTKWKENAAREREETDRATGEHQKRLRTWWRLKRRRSELIHAITQSDRFVACSRVTKRPVFVFVSSRFRPDSSLTCFTFPDDYSFGVLQSDTHWRWFVAKCSKLTERFRYTPESVFDTFPWPQSPTKKQVLAVAEAGREIRRIRAEALKKLSGGLRALYRTLELPGKSPLKDAHAALDAAVLDAYGFDARRDLLSQLLKLNLDVAAAIDNGEQVQAPGVPRCIPDATAAGLITDDCIRPTTP